MYTVGRAGTWASAAARRTWWMTALRLAAWFVPLLLLIALPRLLGSWIGGGVENSCRRTPHAV